ncbi:MAG: Gfo/Idh/MocA family oxidoreductase [Planctomycetes bacterium]|nr:Gfo/Idh/MocA family oxidoreductase [Planctomycetota bacterium]
MIGAGMIFDETYRPFFENVRRDGLFSRTTGPCDVELAAVASRTGRRAAAYRAEAGDRIGDFEVIVEPDVMRQVLGAGVDFVCVATPDHRHFDMARDALDAGKHVLVEKPSVLSLQELDELSRLATSNGVLAKVVYHKLLDPDHKKLRTLVADGVLRHVNNGYCSLLEPKQVSGTQFAEWIQGRNPGTYVAVHYIKLIDFTFGGRLTGVACSGQRGIVGPANGTTWDSIQLRLIYAYPSGREAAFDIHTSWVTPDNFPGYVEQEVQFRFDNGVWNGHSRKRGVECTVEGRTPIELKTTMNNHYNGAFLEPNGHRSRRGYGIEALEWFAREVAHVEFGGPASARRERLDAARGLAYNDLSADRQVVAAVQAMEAILDRAARGRPNGFVRVNGPAGGLEWLEPGGASELLYEPAV